LKSEIAFCEAAPRALSDLGFASSQPVVVAARLLLLRARALADRTDPRQVATAAQALCKLEADDPDDLYDLARNLCLMITDLDSGRWPDLPRQERQGLRRGCADRATEVLVRARERGFRDVERLESSDLRALRQHPGYQALIARLKRP